MSLPKKDFRGQDGFVTMMELRSAPGDVIDRVTAGMTVYITKGMKNGKPKIVAVLVPADYILNRDTTEVLPDGSVKGFMPLTFRRNLGNGGYGK